MSLSLHTNAHLPARKAEGRKGEACSDMMEEGMAGALGVLATRDLRASPCRVVSCVSRAV